MKDKFVDFIKNKGYFLLALICLAVVIVAGISVIYTDNNKADEPTISYNTPVSKPISPTNPSKEPAPTNSTEASKPIDDSQKEEQSGNNSNNSGKIILIKPVDGEIQAEFAAKKLIFNTTLQEWCTHSGVDIKADAGAQVKAAANGIISAVKTDPRYGLCVVINHEINSKTFSTVYCGLANTAESVVAGSEVKAGSIIGVVGEDIFCEKAQGAHIHFELTENDLPLDPTQYWK